MELANLVRQAFDLWQRHLIGTNRTPEKYRSTLYHFDETIKCMLRSFLPLAGTPGIGDAVEACMKSILPSEGDLKDHCEIRYLWGFWFQALLVLCAMNLVMEYASTISLTKRELIRRGYLDKFIAEAEHPDYTGLKTLFKSTVWNDSL
jgi:hypothetical protein